MTLRIESAGATEIPSIVQVMDAAFDARFGEAWTAPQLLTSLGMPETWARLALGANGAPAGFVLTRRILSEAELLLVAVDPGARGQGLGRRLVDDAATVAKGRGAARIFLEVRDGNDAAIGLYRSAGFLVVGRRPGYYAGMSGARFDAITMRRDLAPEL